MTNLSPSTEKKLRGILIKLESPLLREQKRCVDPSDKSCIINKYKQTFMTIMDDLTRDRSRFAKPHLTVWFVYFTNIHLDSTFFLPSSLLFNICISKRIEQILSKRYLVSWFVCPFTLSLHRVILLRDCISEMKQNNVRKYLVSLYGGIFFFPKPGVRHSSELVAAYLFLALVDHSINCYNNPKKAWRKHWASSWSHPCSVTSSMCR